MVLLSFVLSIYIILTVLKFLKKYTKEKEIYNDIENFEYVNNILAEHSNNPEALET